MATKRPAPIPGLLSAAFATGAFFLSLLAVPWCDFATLAIQIYDPVGSPLLQTRLGFGLWRHQIFQIERGGLRIDNQCTGYEEEQVTVDNVWAAARAFGCLAPIIGGLNLMYLYWHYWSACRSAEAKNYAVGTIQSRIVGAIFIVAAFYQMLTLLFLRSSVCKTDEAEEFRDWLGSTVAPATIVYSERCTMSTGANLTIGCTLCWFVAGIFSCVVRPPTRQSSVRDVDASAQVEEPDDGEQSKGGLLPENGEEDPAIACEDGRGSENGEEHPEQSQSEEEAGIEGQTALQIDSMEEPEEHVQDEEAAPHEQKNQEATQSNQPATHAEEQKEQVGKAKGENQTTALPIEEQKEAEQTALNTRTRAQPKQPEKPSTQKKARKAWAKPQTRRRRYRA